MAIPTKCPMPPECALDNGCKVQFVAIDPVTGDAVSGVTVANANIYVQSVGGAGNLASGPFMLVPGPKA